MMMLSGRMASSVATLLLCSISCCAAFRVQCPPLTSVVGRRTTLLKSSLHEFDYLLKEGGLGTPVAVGRRRLAVAIGQDTKTVVVSSTAISAPSMKYEAAESMGSLEEGDTSPIERMGSLDDDPYDTALGAQLNKIQQYQEQQTTMSDRLKKMDLQDIVVTLILPSIAIFAAGRWGYNRIAERVNEKTETYLDSFAKEMLYHDGDFDEMSMCINDYKTKLVYLGPLKNDKMLKRYLESYAKRKTISPQAISSLSYVFTLFKLSEEIAAKTLVSLCREMGTDKIASAGKLLFLGSRILKSPEGVMALKPIKELIKSTYREATVAEQMVEVSQQGIAEAAYRSTVQAGGKNQKGLTVGWEVLGLDRETAERIYKEEAKEGFVSDVEAMYGLQTQKYDKKGRRLDKAGKLENPEESDKDDESDNDGPVSNVYECSDCGYTLFIAQGRESKFFGQDFKCPECGAPKDKFKAREDFDDE